MRMLNKIVLATRGNGVGIWFLLIGRLIPDW
jgi:hypothetical protein